MPTTKEKECTDWSKPKRRLADLWTRSRSCVYADGKHGIEIQSAPKKDGPWSEGPLSKALISLLERQKLEAASTPSKAAVQRKWLEALDQLLVQIKAWLSPLVDQDLIKVTGVSVVLNEDQLGQYEAPSLMLATPGQKTMTIQPRARFIVGGAGRVDIGSGANAAMFIRREDGSWVITRRKSPTQIQKLHVLDEESFSDLLGELLQ